MLVGVKMCKLHQIFSHRSQSVRVVSDPFHMVCQAALGDSLCNRSAVYSVLLVKSRQLYNLGKIPERVGKTS